MTQHILIICLGHICRSPMAQGVQTTLAARAITAATACGYDLHQQRARQLRIADFDDALRLIEPAAAGIAGRLS